MNALRKTLLVLAGEKNYLSVLARSFQYIFPTGLLGPGYQDLYFLRNFVQRDDYCVDIGAHLGYYTLELSRLVGPAGRVFAVEPISKFFHTLQRLIAEKKIINVELRQAAMGAGTEWVEMGIPEIRGTKKFAYARSVEASPFLAFVEKETVRNIKGDDLLISLPRLDFIKCDVEGLEFQVMDSMGATLRRFQPIVLCETANNDERIRIFELLEPLGYLTYFLEHRRLHPLDVRSSRHTISNNHYFIPASRLNRFAGLVESGQLQKL